MTFYGFGLPGTLKKYWNYVCFPTPGARGQHFHLTRTFTQKNIIIFTRNPNFTQKVLFAVKIDFGGPGVEYEQICAFADSGAGGGGGGGGCHIF